MVVHVAMDVAEHAFGSSGGDAGKETSEGGSHDTAEGPEVDSQHDERDGNVKNNVVSAAIAAWCVWAA
jgi:hypothetical protein